MLDRLKRVFNSLTGESSQPDQPSYVGAPQGIFKAAVDGDTEYLRNYLKLDQPLDIVDGSHNSLLFYAAQNENEEFVEMMCQRFWNNSKTQPYNGLDCGRNCAVSYAPPHIQKLLKKYKYTEKKFYKRPRPSYNELRYDNAHENLPLRFEAALQGHLDIIKSEIPNQHDVDSLDPQGNTVLYYAVSEGHLQLVKYLVSLGAGDFGATPVCEATSNQKILNYLRGNGFRSKKKNYNSSDASKKKETASSNISKKAAPFRAAKEGNLRSIEDLIPRKYNVNDIDDEGNTVLYYAALCGHLSIVKYVVEHGARDIGPRRPYDSALTESIRDYLREHGLTTKAWRRKQNRILDKIMSQGHSREIADRVFDVMQYRDFEESQIDDALAIVQGSQLPMMKPEQKNNLHPKEKNKNKKKKNKSQELENNSDYNTNNTNSFSPCPQPFSPYDEEEEPSPSKSNSQKQSKLPLSGGDDIRKTRSSSYQPPEIVEPTGGSSSTLNEVKNYSSSSSSKIEDFKSNTNNNNIEMNDEHFISNNNNNNNNNKNNNKNKNNENENDDTNTCKICFDLPVNALVLPCGHLGMCIHCAKEMPDCPFCRGPIHQIIKTFTV